MQALPVLRLKKGRDRPARAGHPWLFSGAVHTFPEIAPGELCRIEDAAGHFIAVGYANPERSLAVRLLAWHEVDDVDALVRARLRAAIALRHRMLDAESNACRLVHGEGDLLPGLVVDRYDRVLVVQVVTAGMDRLLETVLDVLEQEVQPASIFERSDLPARREENLEMRRRLLRGAPLADDVEIREHGLRFRVQPQSGQKTGFYLDQSPHRLRVRQVAAGRRVLNCFAYTGGFSVAAAAGGAREWTSIESSAPAVELLQRNLELNGQASGDVVQDDAFDVLRAKRSAAEHYDLVVLDPPAFAKKRHQVDSARRGYKEINLQALGLLEAGGEMLTFSCSQHVSEADFRKAVFEAAADARVRVQILARLGAGWDHPMNLSHLEGEYLKGLHLRRL